MIGASAATLLLVNGDIMGLSGIFSSCFLHPINTIKQNPWKLVFLASFFTATALFTKLKPDAISQEPGGAVPTALAYALSGLLVGFGTKLGNGCTSGHGICGLARFSKRSFAAVCTFMATAIATTLLMPAVFRTSTSTPEVVPQHGIFITLASLLVALSIKHVEIHRKSATSPHVKSWGAIVSAGLAAVGLGVSGMVKGAKVGNFLNLSLLKTGGYDPTLMTVMGGGVLVSMMGYQFLPHYTLVCPKNKCMTKPLKDDAFHVPTSTHLDWQLMGGAATFGVGWGLGTLCPGPAFFHVAAGSKDVMSLWFPTYLVGAFLAERLMHHVHQMHHSKTKSS